MTRRADFNARHQAGVLNGLWLESGLDQTTAAAGAFSYPTFRRLIHGAQTLREDLIRPMADALAVTETDLRRALLGEDAQADDDEQAPPDWDLRAVLAAIVGHRFEAAYLLILWGGLRIGEVVSLRWSQIAEDGTVAFEQAEHSQMPGRPIGRTKRERDRETQLPAHVVKRLRGLRAAGPAPMDWPPRPKRDVAYVYVAQRPDGNRWTARRIRDDWNELVARVKIGDQLVTRLTPHGGRRSFGTMHMVSGTPLADLSRLMGHANPAVTAASYLGTSRGRRQAAAEQLAALISPPGTPPKGQEEGHDAV